MTSKRILKSLALVAVAASLTACVSVFPKSKPAQMYRFGVSEAAPSTTPASSVTRIARTPTAFARAAASDRMLTVQGQETAYIAEARWVAPAALLFDDAVEHVFDQRPAGPRLVVRGDLQSADVALRLDVDTFEARYLAGKESPPTVVVSMRATLVRSRDRVVMGEKVFSVQKLAGDNRVGPIAAAYDAAVKDSLGQMADWVAGTVG